MNVCLDVSDGWTLLFQHPSTHIFLIQINGRHTQKLIVCMSITQYASTTLDLEFGCMSVRVNTDHNIYYLYICCDPHNAHIARRRCMKASFF